MRLGPSLPEARLVRHHRLRFARDGVCSRPGMQRLTQNELISGLVAIVGAPHVSTSRVDRIAYSADFWPKAQIWKMGGDIERFPPDCIVWPRTPAEVASILKFCDEHLVPVVPYGAGSGVCGGTVPIHGGVVVDVKRMRHIQSLDADSLTVVVDAGMNGQHLEDALNARGFTLGHFPSSIMCSTVGGWVAARSGGQFSSKYGKIEDMVLGLEVVLPGGELLTTHHRMPGAPDWTQLIIGSEGTLGVITSAELKICRMPEARRFRAFRFKSVAAGLRGMRAVMQAGLRPIVLRLYDPFDSLIALGKEHDAAPKEHGPLGTLRNIFERALARPADRLERAMAPVKHAATKAALATGLAVPSLTNRLANAAPSPCLLITGFEGTEAESQADLAKAIDILTREGGLDSGARLGEAWLEKRYAVGFKQTKMMNLGAWVDTMEVATTWDRLEALYDAVRRAVSPNAFIMAHFSHAYREGCSIYFTMAGHRKDAERAEQHYERTWELAMDAVLAAGGTVSHHHGVGLHKVAAMAREHGGMLKAWYALKQTLDPHGIMNPGKLFPAEVVAADEQAEMDLTRRGP
jgi:alkyldihydroxyacetonephosphate synthase